MPRVIITQSRGDAPRLAEWVTYHARLGFTEFHMILDGLVDDSAEVLSSLEVGARVVVHRYPEEGAYFDDLSPAERSEAVLKWRTDNAEMLAELPYRAVDPQSLRQYRRVGEVLAQITDGQRGWVAHIDADEFIHIPGSNTLGDLLRTAEVPRLRLRSFDVDTTGNDPSLPVLAQHHSRWAPEDLKLHPDARWANRVKSIVRFRAALPLRSLHGITFGRYLVLEPEVARVHHFRVPLQPIDPPLPFRVDDPLAMP